MNPRVLVCLSLALLLAPASLPAQSPAPDPAVLLERARHEAYIRGDFAAAIRTLQSLLDKHADRRPIAAGALVELGQLYESLGRAEARTAYRRVLSDYSDQRDATDLARARLAALTKAETATAAAETGGLRLRKVWESPEGFFYNVSPDGRYVAFQDWGRVSDSATRGNADVALYDTRDRKVRLVTNRPSQSLVDVYPTGPFIWSADGQWMAYGLHAVGWTHRELHIVRPDGRDDRKVLDNRQVADVQPMGFSSDHRFIVASVKGWDNIWRIGVVSLRDSSVAFIKTVGGEQPSLSLSPDDRFIAYSYTTTAGSPAQDILVLAVDGSSEVRVAQHPANDRSPRWTPQGDWIVFTSERSGQRALWAARWQNGRALDEPELVYPHLGELELYGITRTGALYFSARAGGSEVHQATLDLLRDSLPSQPSRLPVSYLLTNQRPKWSPDGERVAWLSQRGARTEPRHLVVKTIANGAERAYPLPFLPGDWRAASLEWSEDGGTVQVQGRDLEKRFRASYLVNLATGEVTREAYLRDFAWLNGEATTEFGFVTDRQSRALRSLGIRLVGQTDWQLLHSGDLTFRPGETAIIVRNGVHRIRSIAAYTAATTNGIFNSASEAQLEHLVGWGATDEWSLSPDGTRIAIDVSSDSVMAPNVLYVVPLAGGPARELVRLPRSGPEKAVFTAIRWTPDGKQVIYGIRRNPVKPGEAFRAPGEFWVVDPDGGTPRRLDLALTPYLLTNLDIHPDGKRIAYTMWRDPVAEVWIAEGLPWQHAGRP